MRAAATSGVVWQRAFTYSTGGGHVRQPRRRGRQRARDGRQVCGDGARAVREDRACLGRVVDRARGACRSKARGLFSYDLATGEFGPAPEGVEGPQRPRRRHGARRVARRRVPARLPPAPGCVLSSCFEQISHRNLSMNRTGIGQAMPDSGVASVTSRRCPRMVGLRPAAGPR